MQFIPLYPPSFYYKQPSGYVTFPKTKTKSQKPSFRHQYPFLSDPSCPPELKILAANKLTAYHNFRHAHQLLFDCSNLQQSFLAVKQLVENYIENQQIFKELNYYKEHGSPLGQHPVFKEYQQLQQLRALSPIEWLKEQERVEHNIWRIQSEIKKNDKPHLHVQREKSLQQKQTILAELTRLINATLKSAN